MAYKFKHYFATEQCGKLTFHIRLFYWHLCFKESTQLFHLLIYVHKLKILIELIEMTGKQQILTFVLSCIFKISSTISDKSMSNSLAHKRIRKKIHILKALSGAVCVQNKDATIRRLTIALRSSQLSASRQLYFCTWGSFIWSSIHYSHGSTLVYSRAKLYYQ